MEVSYEFDLHMSGLLSMEETGGSLPEGTLLVPFPRALSGTEEVSLNIRSPHHVFIPTQRRKIA